MILRNYIELAELSVAVIADEIFFDHYKSTPTDRKDVNVKWQKTKPSAVHKLVGMEYSKIDGSGCGTNFERDMLPLTTFSKKQTIKHDKENSILFSSHLPS